MLPSTHGKFQNLIPFTAGWQHVPYHFANYHSECTINLFSSFTARPFNSNRTERNYAPKPLSKLRSCCRWTSCKIKSIISVNSLASSHLPGQVTSNAFLGVRCRSRDKVRRGLREFSFKKSTINKIEKSFFCLLSGKVKSALKWMNGFAWDCSSVRLPRSRCSNISTTATTSSMTSAATKSISKGESVPKTAASQSW